MTLTLIFLAIAAGLWRVVDGRGKEWLPVPPEARAILNQINDAVTRFPA